jgi:predicted nucleic acid-binding protein
MKAFVIDSNIIFSALLKNSAARKIILSIPSFYSTGSQTENSDMEQ